MPSPFLTWPTFSVIAMALFTVEVGHAAPGETTLVSVRAPGQVTSMNASQGTRISADGRFVTFFSASPDLVAGDTNLLNDGFVRDLQTGTIDRVSVSSAGAEASSDTTSVGISGNGRFVVIASAAKNLVPGDNNGVGDIFVRDRQAGLTERVSVTSAGAQATRASYTPTISTDGRYVAFASRASNLVTGDTNNADDIFVRDRQSGVTERISVNSTGQQADRESLVPAISAAGRYVAFASRATNLVAGDSNGVDDVFVRDRQTGQTERVSVGSGGVQANGLSGQPSVSSDGRFVAFNSAATNLVAGDTNGSPDVFVRDRQTGVTERVSVDSGGVQAAMSTNSFSPWISPDGRYVAFVSSASLVANDTNSANDVYVRDRMTGQTARASTSTAHPDPNGQSVAPSLSADGRYVAFDSLASNLVAGDYNSASDAFVRDRQASTVTVASIGKIPNLAAGGSSVLCCDEGLGSPSITADGRYIAFLSTAGNLVRPDDQLAAKSVSSAGQVSSNVSDAATVYVRDRQDGTTIAIPQSYGSNDPVISGNGELVAFRANGGGPISGWDRQTGVTTQLVPYGYDTAVNFDGRFVAYRDDEQDLRLLDRQSGLTEQVDVDSAGVPANDFSESPWLSSDARYVAFASTGSNLVPGDTNGEEDVFVRDRQTGKTERVSVDSGGAQGNGDSRGPSISADGRFVAFYSFATNLAPGAGIIFVHDRQTGQTQRLGDGSFPVISGNGRYVAIWDVYVYDRQTGELEPVSVDANGDLAGNSYGPAISADGRSVAFNSDGQLVSSDLNVEWDAYVRDRWISALTVSPSAVNFGSQAVNSTSSPQVITVHNTTATAVPITSISFSGANPGQFARTQTCGSSLAAGATCTISVTFRPTNVGAKSVSLLVNGTGANSGTVSLTGRGVGASPTFTLSPGSLTFANQPRNTSSAARVVTLANTGSAPVKITSRTLTGTNPGQFSQTSNCGSTVPVGGSCTISIAFKPTSVGNKTATLSVTAANGAGSHTTTVSGRGT